MARRPNSSLLHEVFVFLVYFFPELLGRPTATSFNELIPNAVHL